jgi:hypothetical protein
MSATDTAAVGFDVRRYPTRHTFAAANGSRRSPASGPRSGPLDP